MGCTLSLNVSMPKQIASAPAPLLKDIHPSDSPADTHERMSNPPISEFRNANRIEMTFMAAPPCIVASRINIWR
jgi:hypothetical protein